MTPRTLTSPTFVNGDVSFWHRSIGMPGRRASLDSNLAVDVAIVGGGLTGSGPPTTSRNHDPTSTSRSSNESSSALVPRGATAVG